MEQLLLAKCKRCGYLVYALQTSTISMLGREVTVASAYPSLKINMAQHLNVSHKEGIEYALHVTLKDYKAFFYITAIQNTQAEPNAVESIFSVINNKGFWVAIRNHPTLENTLFSGLGRREYKLFLKSQGNKR